METTEKKFSDWCRKRVYFSKKLMTHTSTGYGGNQEADFLMANNKGVYLVECKERHGDLFEFEGLTQEKKLLRVTKRTNKIQCIIIINFIEHKTLVLLTLNQYLKLKGDAVFNNGKERKSLKLNQILDRYKTTWKELEI